MRKSLFILVAALAGFFAGCGERPTPPPVARADSQVTVRDIAITTPDGPREPRSLPPEWEETRRARDRAVEYVLRTQNADGSWGGPEQCHVYELYLGGYNSLHAYGNASMALVCMGLLGLEGTPDVDAALLKGYDYLANGPAAKRISTDTFYNVWAHTYVLEALALGLSDSRLSSLDADMRRRCAEELRLLMGLQAADGGWGYFDFEENLAMPSGRYSTSFNTGAALVALWRAKQAGFPIDPGRVAAAFAYLRAIHFPNDAYSYSTGGRFRPRRGGINDPKSSLGRTHVCNLALRLWGRDPGEEVMAQAFATFFEHHHFFENGRQRQFPHEAYYAVSGYFFYFAHAYAAWNIDALPTADRRAIALRQAQLIAPTQGENDGAFWDFPIYGYSKVYGTGYALIALNTLLRHAAGN